MHLAHTTFSSLCPDTYQRASRTPFAGCARLRSQFQLRNPLGWASP